MPLAKLNVVVLDCPDPLALAEFYAAVIGGTPTPGDEGWYDLKAHGGHGGQRGATLAFQEAPGFVRPTWPSPDASQQFHLDLTVEDMDDMNAVEKEILALGATVLDAADRDRSWRVYADPAGHPFCLCAC
ncbi:MULTISPECIES: VOC family protein [unclassified Streptomyces]|uniref:VOC family protein n=1 Tax=unclassified Streptomyces TaxID=2593676 RepID=UPI0033DF9FF1